MKNPKGNSLRWLDQAKHDLEVAEKNLELLNFYSDACFLAEQASQKALKAYLYFKGERYITIHSVRELIVLSSKYDKEFEKFIEYGMILDSYYIPTRYPDALAPPAVPYKSYTKKEATEAVNSAREIIRFVETNITS
ncbi:MAG: HEPN domain-containing protein [Candidatus Omnitrophica bacterium]|nr:HEPN domain-containing protein [Candidatus Omnitrophota bacterium]